MAKTRSLSISAPSYLLLVDLIRNKIESFKNDVERYEEYCKEHSKEDNDDWMKDYSFEYRRKDYDEAMSKLPSFQNLLLELYGFGG